MFAAPPTDSVVPTSTVLSAHTDSAFALPPTDSVEPNPPVVGTVSDPVENSPAFRAPNTESVVPMNTSPATDSVVPNSTFSGTASSAVLNEPAFRDPDTDSDVPTVIDSGTVSVCVEKAVADRSPVTLKSPSNSDSESDPDSERRHVQRPGRDDRCCRQRGDSQPAR